MRGRCRGRFLYENGYKNILGIDINDKKIEKAKNNNPFLPLTTLRLMDLSKLDINDNYFDIIWCSHTLEHVYEPETVLKEFKRVCKKDGKIYFILPYPGNTCNVHCAASKLKLDIEDGGKSCAEYIKELGFEIVNYETLQIREPELFLKFVNTK